MDALQQKFSIPNAKLHESDIKLIQKFCSFLNNLSDKVKFKIEDRFPTRYSIIVDNPPTLNIKDMKQIDMMSINIKSVCFEMEKNKIKIDIFKNGQKKSKRPREIEQVAIPYHYDFKKIEKNDLKHVKSIFGYLVALTDREFTVQLHKETLEYNFVLTDLESFSLKDMIHIHEKFSAFINSCQIHFSEKKMSLRINKIN